MSRDRALDRRIVGMAVPALGALAVEPLYTLVDTAIVGRLGKEPLAGLAAATVVLNVAVYGSGFLAMATTQRVALARGGGDDVTGARAVVTAYAVALGLGALLAAVVAGLAVPMGRALGASGGALDASTTYLRWSALGLPFALCLLAGNGHRRGLGDTRTPLVVAVAANVANVVLEVLLVPVLGFGVAGSAIGTVIAQVGAGVWFLGGSVRLVGRVGVPLRPTRDELARLWRVGGALVVRTAALLSVMVATTAVAGRVGVAALAGHQIGRQVFFLLALSLDALAVPGQVLVPEAIGAGLLDDARAVGARVLRLSVGCGVVLGLVAAAVAPLAVRVFTTDPDVRRAATIAIVVCGLSQAFAGAAFALDGIVLGAGDVAALRRAMVLAALAVAPPLAVVWVRPSLGIGAIWAATAWWLAARTLLLLPRWRPAIAASARG